MNIDEAKLVELFRKVVREEMCREPAQALAMEDAARRLSVSTRTLRRMAHAGELALVVVGRTPKVPLSELERIVRQARPATGPKGPGERAPRRGAPSGKARRQLEAAKAAALAEARRLRRSQARSGR